jgi:hypothetical protein
LTETSSGQLKVGTESVFRGRNQKKNRVKQHTKAGRVVTGARTCRGGTSIELPTVIDTLRMTSAMQVKLTNFHPKQSQLN